MARTPFNAALVSGGATYTVPADKEAVFTSFFVKSTATAKSGIVLIGGVKVAGVGTTSESSYPPAAHPLTAGAGAIVSLTASDSGVEVGINGFLYSV